MNNNIRFDRFLWVIALFAISFACSSDDDDFQDEEFLSNRKEILSFEFQELSPPVAANVNSDGLQVTATVPFGTDLSSLTPTIQISENATISPPSGVENDFSTAATYVVTAEDGSTADWTVEITEAEQDAQARLVLSEPVWNFSPSGTGVPSFFEVDGERGLAYANDRLYITSNNDKIIMINPMDGGVQGELNMDGVEGGQPIISDVAASADGSILACNTVEWTSDEGGDPTTFKIYRWADNSSAPTVFLTYTNTQYRMGDSFTVIGDVSGDAIILTTFGRKFLNPTDRGNLIFRWNVTGGVVDEEPELIEVGGLPNLTRFGSRPHAQMLDINSSEIYTNANDIEITKVGLDGAFLSRLPNSGRNLFDGFTSYFEIFEFNDRTIIATCFPRSAVESRLILIDVTDGLENVTEDNVVLSQNLMAGSGEIANINAGGAVAVNMAGGNRMEIFLLITNQALVKYNLSLEFD